ncbi:hypothetical protein K504DRAFT_467729 [Pleomassaria siparia CBS 279.74]|uniref:TPR-like protein n=1 Tax=Pleomassaria siparia CBS 279.74 TaxID=1314801 RepID=A0A6G1KAF1_9PLEO|nr:hypothetical protein K504DRAFT_467729 [Pleomassaria siparia CBS 279.74]
MPPSRKDLIKPKSKAKGKLKPQEPQSENDFLEQADEFEQAAGKWRAGDVAKATRFFMRAIEAYNAGLQRYPTSFDLAYNKANLEYTMIDDPRIATALGPKVTLLEQTLASHRMATDLDPSNTDILFNTAQVLTSLSELLLENVTGEKGSARGHLEEAVSIFTKCLVVQQAEYEQTQADLAAASAMSLSEDQGVSEQEAVQNEEAMETESTSGSSTPGDWATVVEPLTPTSILETCTAQLAALTTLLSLYDPSDLPSIESLAQNGLETANIKIPTLITLIQSSPSSKPIEEPAPGPTLSIGAASAVDEPEAPPESDALIAVANFQTSLAEISYRNGRSDASQYAAQIEQLFAPLTATPEKTSEFDPGFTNALSAYADAHIELASAVSDPDVQWASLTKAQTLLTQISKYTAILSPSRMADIFAARGDTDLFRFQLSLSEQAKSTWVKSKPVLVANAGVFYRGARTYAEKAGAGDIHKTSDAKAIVAEILKQAASGVEEKKTEWKGKGEIIVRVLEQMIEEGIVGRENAEGVLRFIR